MRYLIKIVFLILSLSGFAQSGKLEVTVSNLNPAHGRLMIFVFDSTATRLNSEASWRAIRKMVVPVTDSKAIIVIDSLKKGRYAIKALHDENSNGKFEFTREDYGFSGGRGGIGPPGFNEAAFYLDGSDAMLDVFLENEFSSQTSAYKGKVAFAPVVSYAPETSLLLGVNMIKLFRDKGGDSVTRTSYLDVLAVVTLNKQLIIEQNYLIFTRSEKFLFNGFTGFSKFPQFYYGIGNHAEPGKDLINYQQFRFEHLAMKRIFKKMFAGVGYRYNNLFNLTYPDSSHLTTESVKGKQGAVSSGIQFALASDYRDNIFNTKKGHLFRLKSTFNSTTLGSTYTFSTHELDLRQFIQPFNGRQDVLALQLYGYFSQGDVPWNEMATLGSDMIMRGYYSGRYRDKQYLAFQAEYRRPFNKAFGMVFFVGAGDVASQWSNFDTRNLKPNIGTGFRMTIDRREKLNLRLDLGFGQNTSNVYFTISEAF